jgi:hypothetical protein
MTSDGVGVKIALPRDWRSYVRAPNGLGMKDQDSRLLGACKIGP